jgi:hypothetical protein
MAPRTTRTTETLDDRANRLLVEGRVSVQRIDTDGTALGTVLGSRPHPVSRSRFGVFRCDCDAYQHDRPCCHIAALRKVVTPQMERQATA